MAKNIDSIRAVLRAVRHGRPVIERLGTSGGVLLGLTFIMASFHAMAGNGSTSVDDMELHTEVLKESRGLFLTSHAFLGWTLIALGLAIVLVALWSSLPSPANRAWAYISESFHMRNLFIKVRFSPDAPKTSDLKTTAGEMTERRLETGYLKSLGMVDASIVSYTSMRPGEKLVIFPDSIPEFPADATPIAGRVIKCFPLKGTPQSYQLRVAFEAMNDAQRQTLRAYLGHLGTPTRKATSA